MTEIKMHVGETAKQFLTSNHRQARATQWDNSPFIYPEDDGSGESFTFVYDDPLGSFVIPSARLIWISQYAGLLYEATVDTSAQKSSLVDTHRDMSNLQTTLLHSGWKAEQPLPTLEEMRKTVSASSGTTTAFGTAKYTRGTMTASLLLSMPGSVITGQAAADLSFVAELDIEDNALRLRAGNMAFGARAKERGTEDRLLPLTYWLAKQ